MANKLAPRAGRANKEELIRQGRLRYNSSRGIDPNPNPAIGHAVNEETGMRAGLTPEKYHLKVLLSERRRKMGKEYDFVPELTDEEWEIYQDWLKKGGAEKMRTERSSESREQVRKALDLSKKHDKAGTEQVESLPEKNVEASSPDGTPTNDIPAGYDKVDPDAPEEEPEVVGGKGSNKPDPKDDKKKPGPKPKGKK